MADTRSPLAKARHYGAAGSAVRHWITLRALAVLLVPLSLWLAVSLIGLAGASRIEILNWISQPVHAVLLVLTLGAMLWHGALGCTEIIEDYVQHELGKFISKMAVNVTLLGFGIAGLLAILKIVI